MDNMHDNIDQLFRNQLESFEPTPSPKVWNGVSRGLSWHEFIHLNVTNFAHNIYLIAGTIATTTLITLATIIALQESPIVLKSGEKNQALVSETTTIKPPIQATGIKQDLPYKTPVKEPSAPINLRTENQHTTIVARSGENDAGITPMQPIAAGAITVKDDTLKKSDFWTRSWEKIAGLDGFYKHPGKFSVGLSTGYDQFTQPLEDELKTTLSSSTNQLKLRYENYGFQIETGLAHHQWEENGLYDATYRDWDTIYSYIRVDYFIPDPTNPDSVVLITQTVYVYDSVTKATTLLGQNRYNYLTIPLQFGYRIADYGRFGLTAWVGGAISFEATRDIGKPQMPSGVKSSIKYTTITPERRSQWFMYTAGLRFDIMFNRRVQLEIEPYYRAYRHSLYKEGNLSSPHSLGINAGLSIKF